MGVAVNINGVCRYRPDKGPHGVPRVSVTEGPWGRPALWIQGEGLSIVITANTFWHVFEQLCHHDKVADLIKPERLPDILARAHEHGTEI